MRDYQAELNALRERIAGRKRDMVVLADLRRQEEDCRREVEALSAKWNKEQRDVDRLEKLTLASILASIRGSKDEDISRERAEAYAARLKLQEAERQLEEVRGEILERQRRIRETEGCEARYQTVLREKEAELRDRDPALAARLAELERWEMELTVQRKELREAVDAGERALTQLDMALGSLDSAEGWGTWDVFGGGLLTDMMKYDHLDKAQAQMTGVQNALRRYQAELADVAQAAAFDIRPGDFLSVADMLFDNIFADWAVLDHIRQSQGQLANIRSRVEVIQRDLRRNLMGTEEALDALRGERDELIRRA